MGFTTKIDGGFWTWPPTWLSQLHFNVKGGIVPLSCAQLSQIWRRYAPPFLRYLRNNPPVQVRVLNHAWLRLPRVPLVLLESPLTNQWGNILAWNFNPRPGRGGGCHPPEVFLRCTANYEADGAEILIVYGASFAQLLVKKCWPGHVRSRSYDVTRSTR